MRIDKKIKGIPWPEPYEGGNQDFIVTFSWPVIDHERLMVATFVRNRNKKTWRTPREDFRLICSKKNGTASILYKNARAGRRKNLRDALYGLATNPDVCYPEISQKDESALGKWLGMDPKDSHNHLMPQLSDWVSKAVHSETLREKDARGELRDEDVFLCPEELPDGLVEYIRRNVLPQDNVLIYKKGNTRGTCFQCREKVKAIHPNRFRHGEPTTCPNCGQSVYALLETSDSFRVDYMEDIATIQKGADGKTVFVRQWHILRDPAAQWENIPGQLEEVARYAVRGNRAAKWQHEAKEANFMNTVRYRLTEWTRASDVASTYDGQYFMYIPPDWRGLFAGTCLQYCDIQDYADDAKKSIRDRYTIRFLMDWARYPMMEKLWKAGYTGLIHERLRGMNKEYRNVIVWTHSSIREAIRFPQRLLKLWEPSEWTMNKMYRVTEAWQLVRKGYIRESEIEELVKSSISLEFIRAALGHASIHKIIGYLGKHIEIEKAGWKDSYSWRVPNTPTTYRDYLADCLKLGWNLDDHSILFPPNLDAAHARTIAQVKYKNSEISARQFESTRQKQLWLEWEHDGLLIRLPVDGKEIIAEGEYLHHCVGGYVQRAATGTTTILFIRKVSDPDTPYFTLEWLGGHVNQCKAKNNRDYSGDEKVASFVQAWVNHVRYLKNKNRKEKTA